MLLKDSSANSSVTLCFKNSEKMDASSFLKVQNYSVNFYGVIPHYIHILINKIMFNRTFLLRNFRGMQVTQSHLLHFLPTGGRVNDCSDTHISRGPPHAHTCACGVYRKDVCTLCTPRRIASKTAPAFSPYVSDTSFS